MGKRKGTAGFGEISQFVNRPQPTAFRINIMQFPSGIWGYVGTIPFALTEENKRSLVPDARQSRHFPTKSGAITAAESAGFKEGRLYSLETGKEVVEPARILPTRKPMRITPKTPRLSR